MAHSTKLRTGRMCNPSECVTTTFWRSVGPLMAEGFPEGQKDGRTGGDGAGSGGMMVQAALEQVPDGLARAGRAQALHDLADDLFLRGRPQFRDDRVTDHEIGHAHG